MERVFPQKGVPMKRVKVTFYVEASDPEHDLGVSEEHFEQISDAIAELAEDAPEFEPER